MTSEIAANMFSRLFIVYLILQAVNGIILNRLNVPSPRTLGGEEVEDEDYASFMCSVRGENKEHICGSSILSIHWILTAAQCVYGRDSKNIHIMEGSLDINGGYFYDVENYFCHPKFKHPRFGYDAAIIRVKGQIRPFLIFSKATSTISYADTQVPDDELIEMTGWGKISKGEPSSQRLRIYRTTVMAKGICKEMYESRIIDESMFCSAAQAGEGICFGDAGSPVVWRSSNPLNPPIQVGIVAFSIPCGAGYPNVYTKTSKVHKWIKNVTGI